VQASCFASSASMKLNEGKKVVGSGAGVFGDVLLQHGSILLGKGHNFTSRFNELQNEEIREMIRKENRKPLHSISEICNREISYEECANCIWEEFNVI
jgi:lipoate-protein ligase A